MSEYLDRIVGALKTIAEEERVALDRASDAVADAICSDGLVHVFGCGHSHLAALDAFYRAGGLACVSPVLDVDLMLHDGAAKSSRMEKMSGIAAEVICRPPESLGNMLASAKNYLETAEVFAITATIILLSLVFEKLLKYLYGLWAKKHGADQ